MSKSKEYMRVTVWDEKKATYPAIIQPKHNGVRFLDNGDTVVTREGNPHKPHIVEAIRERWGKPPAGWTRDGEACCEISEGISLQKITGAVKKEKPLSKKLIFPVFDGCCKASPGIKFSARFAFVGGDCETIKVCSQDELNQWYEKWLAMGYEGLIYRTDSPYRWGSALERVMKKKPLKHAEFMIAAVWEGTGKAVGTPVYRLWRPGHGPGEEVNNKTTFGASPDGPYEDRYELWAERDEVIGKMLTIHCWDFYDSGVPQFPVAEAVRDYE
jgi:hypothetical protein